MFFAAGNKIMAADVKTDGPAFERGIPKEIFEARMVTLPITVVLNWASGVRR